MAKAKGKSAGWLTRQDMAKMFDVRPEHFDKSYRSFIPDRFITRNGRRVLFDPRSVRAIMDGVLASERDKSTIISGDPMLADGSDSPAMERYRQARAESAELDLALRKGEIIPVDTASEILAISASRIRRATDQLGQAHGENAKLIIEHALDEAEEELEAALGSTAKTNT